MTKKDVSQKSVAETNLFVASRIPSEIDERTGTTKQQEVDGLQLGNLSHYADKKLRTRERGAFARAVIKKHKNLDPSAG